MRGGPSAALVAALLAGLLPGPPAGLAAAADGKEPSRPGVRVTFVSPPDDEPVVGTAEIEVRVTGAKAAEVVFFIDGEEVGRTSRPPHRIEVSLGEGYGPRRFEVSVRGPAGEVARAVRSTPGLRVDEVVELGLQQLYVSVTPELPDGESLRRSDFEVLDQGVRQSIVTFERGDAALTAALLLDASDSMLGGRLEAALEGARAFMRGMRSLDEAAIVLFADAIRYRSAFSQEPEVLAGALRGVRAGGGTALNDALFLALRQLERQQGRRVVVLLSDGVDVHSALRMSDLLWTAHRSRSVVYWIELRSNRRESRHLSPWRDWKEHAAEIKQLRRLVKETGGRVVRIASTAQARGAFEEILLELRRQYVIGYYPSVTAGRGAWHTVEVRLRPSRFTARTRDGYVEY